MLIDYKLKEETIYNYFINSVCNGKISHAYLIEDNGNQLESYNIIISIIKYLLCPSNNIKKENCGNCNICSLINDLNYPELKIIEPDGINIKKEQMLDLQNAFSTKPIYGKYRICIIKSSEKLNSSSANSILKFLEEPTENVIIFLMANYKYKVIPTIVSRCQVLKLNLLNNKVNNLSNNIKNNYFNEEKEYVEYVKKIVSLIKEFEIVKYEILANKEIYNYKDNLKLFLDAMILVYNDMLNKSKCINVYDKYCEEISSICSSINQDDIIKRINALILFSNNEKYNVNKELFIDNLFISMVEGK